MPTDVTYEIHNAAETERLRHRERDGASGILRRVVGGLGRLRPAILRQPETFYGAHVLTDKVCRLADGSLGRVAIRESNGEVTEVCVPA